MKTLATILIAVLTIPIGYGQSDCEPYLPADVGTQWEMSNYNAKGKLQGTIQYELIDKSEQDGELVFTVSTKSFDKKGKEQFSSEFKAKCIDGNFEFDMAMKMDGAMMQQYQEMDFEVDASSYEIPDLDAAVGTELPDGSMRITIGDGPVGINMTVDITERKVAAREQLTTPAGQFDCLVLEQAVTSKVLINVKGRSKEWYSPNIGVVRTESYNKKGKLLGYSELTKLSGN